MVAIAATAPGSPPQMLTQPEEAIPRPSAPRSSGAAAGAAPTTGRSLRPRVARFGEREPPPL